ncbi:DUF4435 domain-containing protein [Leptospira sp. WS4.C2]
MIQNYNIELPLPDGTKQNFETKQTLFFVGANGSGKTRIGSWIELSSNQRTKVHRISAQKSLSMPDSITPVSIDLAENNLYFGNEKHTNNKSAYKWGNKPATFFLNDFEKLMVYLFSDETESNANFKTQYKLTNEKIPAPITKLDIIKGIWDKILPHRELLIGGLRIQTKTKGTTEKIYQSSEMSDGERVIFYLIGQCLSAPKNSIIIVDEPELHLHKSIQNSLWTEIQKNRQDCLFVFLTHDVDFVSAQTDSTKIWIKNFDGSKWDWEFIDVDQTVPEPLLFEILGSRKPIVFVEGNEGSFDVGLYRSLLKDYLVIPKGSCKQVIQSVKSFKINKQLHHLEVKGIIDRDRRMEAEIELLKKDSIYTLKVAEVENLFCTKEVLKIVSLTLARNPDEDFKQISDFIFQKLSQEIELQVSLKTAREIKFQLNTFDENTKDLNELKKTLDNLIATIDIKNIYDNFYDEYKAIIDTKNYEELLKVYNRKSLSTQISKFFDLKSGSLSEFVIRLSKTNQIDEIKQSLLPYFDDFFKN